MCKQTPCSRIDQVCKTTRSIVINQAVVILEADRIDFQTRKNGQKLTDFSTQCLVIACTNGVIYGCLKLIENLANKLTVTHVQFWSYENFHQRMPFLSSKACTCPTKQLNAQISIPVDKFASHARRAEWSNKKFKKKTKKWQ